MMADGEESEPRGIELTKMTKTSMKIRLKTSESSSVDHAECSAFIRSSHGVH